MLKATGAYRDRDSASERGAWLRRRDPAFVGPWAKPIKMARWHECLIASLCVDRGPHPPRWNPHATSKGIHRALRALSTGILLRQAARHLDENRHCDSGTCAWLALLLDRQQHFDLYAHNARSAPLGQRMLQMVQLGNVAKPRTDRAELFAKSCRRQNGFS